MGQNEETRSRLRIVPMSLRIANSFVAQHHRHNKPVVGAKITLGVADAQGTLRGVAIIGCPVARMLNDGWTLEVTRVCTDGCPNACSALYGAARRVAFQLGYHRLLTYTLQSESGSSLRGAGWRQVAEVHPSSGHGWLNRPGRIAQSVYDLPKYRWEAVPPAAQRYDHLAKETHGHTLPTRLSSSTRTLNAGLEFRQSDEFGGQHLQYQCTS